MSLCGRSPGTCLPEGLMPQEEPPLEPTLTLTRSKDAPVSGALGAEPSPPPSSCHRLCPRAQSPVGEALRRVADNTHEETRKAEWWVFFCVT